MTAAEARKNFNEFIAKGNRLTYEEIRMLNTIHKKDYIGHVLKEDDRTQEYLHQANQYLIEKHDEVTKLIWDITDLNDEWAAAVDRIN
jgi:uncharacterized phage-like protein YoqJ